MKAFMIMTICAVALLGVFASLAATPAAAKAPPPEGIPQQGGVDPAAIFTKLCAGCHGDKGQGGYGPALTHLSQDGDARLAGVITHGQGKMPAAGSKLSAAEVDALIRFMISGFTVSPPAEARQAEAAPAGAAVLPASLRVDLSQGTPGGVTVRISLRSPESVPIPGAAVSLRRSTAMGGSLLVAELTTDAHGEASYTLEAVKGQAVKLEAAYAGDGKWGPARGQASAEVQDAPGAPSLITALTSRSAPATLAIVFAAVVGGVWLTYGFVAYRLLQILRLAKE